IERRPERWERHGVDRERRGERRSIHLRDAIRRHAGDEPGGARRGGACGVLFDGPFGRTRAGRVSAGTHRDEGDPGLRQDGRRLDRQVHPPRRGRESARRRSREVPDGREGGRERVPDLPGPVDDESAFTKANRDNWNASSKAYQADHHAELEGDVLWGLSMPPERELRILGESVLGKDILEIACGGGQSAVHLATMGARVTAVDFSKAQLEHARAFARSKNASVRFLEADVQDLSMVDHGSFEIAFSAYAL